ncbi:hypothetical protein ACN06F_07265 [Vreelandella sp. 21]
MRGLKAVNFGQVLADGGKCRQEAKSHLADIESCKMITRWCAIKGYNSVIMVEYRYRDF